ncbi:MAG: methylated-DNA--[protein]-cysteine S-methyltransferase [Candidatus Aminicenantes bacterium]|nr:methylated-DNA--[protein]-cysteine S-methyltransferase [Candidatus Aminicenantes bacterium]
MENIYRAYYRSEIGLLEITGTQKEILSVNFVKKKGQAETTLSPVLKTCLRQLDEYFRGKRQNFSVRLRLGGTAFQNRVWRELLKVGFGKTASYRDIAKAAGCPRAVRAVGNTNRLNPVGIIVPCHRIIGSDGKLVGYGGGLWRKKWLLEHEQAKAK